MLGTYQFGGSILNLLQSVNILNKRGDKYSRLICCHSQSLELRKISLTIDLRTSYLNLILTFSLLLKCDLDH